MKIPFACDVFRWVAIDFAFASSHARPKGTRDGKKADCRFDDLVIDMRVRTREFLMLVFRGPHNSNAAGNLSSCVCCEINQFSRKLVSFFRDQGAGKSIKYRFRKCDVLRLCCITHQHRCTECVHRMCVCAIFNRSKSVLSCCRFIMVNKASRKLCMR